MGSLYLLKDPVTLESYTLLMKIFRSHQGSSEHNPFFVNCLIFFTLLI